MKTMTTLAATMTALAGAGVIAELSGLPLAFAILVVVAAVTGTSAFAILAVSMFSRARRPVSVRRAVRATA